VSRDRSLSQERIADLVGALPAAVCSWIDAGALIADRTPAGIARVQPSVLRAFLLARSMPIPLELVGAKRLLMIDDEPLLLRSTARALKQAVPDLQIDLADGPELGLALAQSLRPDAILVDAYMPELTGVEVCARIKGNPDTAHIIVIATTADPSQGLALAFAGAGAGAFLEKPLSPQVLIEALATTLQLGRELQ
jgi:CheY-like chemotaxis protein